MTTRSKYVSLAEAAHQLRIPYQQAHNLLLIGILSGKKRRGRWLIERHDVDQQLESGAIEAGEIKED